MKNDQFKLIIFAICIIDEFIDSNIWKYKLIMHLNYNINYC